jgi:hypothetical protein
MGDNHRVPIRDSHRVTFGLYACSRTGYHFRYEPEVRACQAENPDLLITPYSRIRISLPNVPRLHNLNGTVIGVEGPVVDKRFKIEGQGDNRRLQGQDHPDYDDEEISIAKKDDVKSDTVMTYRVLVQLDDGDVINALYSDQVAQLSEFEIRNEMQGRAMASKKRITRPSRVIGQTPLQPFPAPVVKETDNFERGFAEGLGEDISGDEIDPDSIDIDYFDDDESVDINM